MTKEEFAGKLQDFDALWLTLFGEARGEPIEGLIAVGCVIRNRVNTQKKTYKEICLADNQFSCWNSDDPNLPIMMDNFYLINPLLTQIKFISAGIIQQLLLDNTKGATHYLTTSLFKTKPPRWAMEGKMATIKGNQTFIICA
ncbi:MAG TPA: cell wall hydrolase [Nitrosopumilaceae archaeon]|jgi:N-acetylmuramoyl-L-alanine amidase|nr:cell wall hydrolase [Nitrosopumilaceae archaeon]